MEQQIVIKETARTKSAKDLSIAMRVAKRTKLELLKLKSGIIVKKLKNTLILM